MHELSIAQSIVEMVSAHLEETRGARVVEVRLRVGLLAGIATESLLFCYEIAAQDTLLAGSKLVVNEVPVTIFCPVCLAERELPGCRQFRCPVCDTPCGDIRQGRELEIESMVVDEYSRG